jgi:hypothetical protein
MRAAALALAACGLATACVPPSTGPGGVETLRGRPAVVGSAPMNVQVSLRAEDGRSITLTGALAPELGRLSGAEVEVEGLLAGSEMEATAYRIVSVDGRPVVLGIVETAPGGGLQLRLDDGGVVVLGAGAEPLRPGQKVWVQGVSRLHVQTFGVVVP